MKRLNHFTLIELLVVIGIIGILASVLYPAVRNALIETKVTEAQVIAQKIENKIAEYNIKSKESLNSVANESSQDELVKILAGVSPITPNATEDRAIEDPNYAGDFIGVDGVDYMPRIPSNYFRIDESGKLAMIKNGFGQPFQIVKRLNADRGTITLRNTSEGDETGQVFTRIKVGNSKLMVFSVDDNGRIIGSKGLAGPDNNGSELYGSDLTFDLSDQ